MSGRLRLVKWIRYYQNLRKKFPTLKELERTAVRENQIRKELEESDFHEITWDKKEDKKDV